MFRHIIAGLTALSLTVSTASPVRASGFTDEEIGKLLFGLAAIAAIGTLVENNRERQRGEATRQSPRVEVYRPGRQHRQYNSKVLPRRCLNSYETRFGTHRMFGAHCLSDSYAFADDIPRACAVRIFTNDGPRRGYDPACLRARGYTARH